MSGTTPVNTITNNGALPRGNIGRGTVLVNSSGNIIVSIPRLLLPTSNLSIEEIINLWF